jgi:hypothetical protein
VVKIIWVVWLQGWSKAPSLVHSCLSSWQLRNPGWDVRALDLNAIRLLIDLPEFTGKQITPASFSDLVRISLLHEFGGVWVDATLLCRRPLDGWLPSLCKEGFFAFHRPGPDRELASWFLAADRPGHPVVSAWHDAVCSFWSERSQTQDYFWFHHLFGQLCSVDPSVRDVWSRVPKMSADGPHRAQQLRFDNDNPDALAAINAEAAPVLKLTYRFDGALLERSCLITWLIRDLPRPALLDGGWPAAEAENAQAKPTIAGLEVSTENLGDHIQILAANRLVKRLWGAPSVRIDRDHDIASLATSGAPKQPLPIVVNGWFKTNPSEWPPHTALRPAYVGFHLRPFQCPTLLSPVALDHYQRFAPIGCRDVWTRDLLQAHGVDAYLSHCLSLVVPRRRRCPAPPSEVFVVSRDPRICAHLPAGIGPYTYLSHYSGHAEFELNLLAASRLLALYAARARLIITTLLHCALPAMAMGIPVVMVWPINPPAGRESDRQRFSSLVSMLPILEPEELASLDGDVQPVACTTQKLMAFDGFQRATRQWQLPPVPPAWGLAPSAVLPPPR